MPEMVPAGDVPELIRARRGFSVAYRGKTLLSTVDPITRAEQLASSFPLRERTLYLCPSPLLGYGLERLLARMTDNAPYSALLCVEADEHLLQFSLDNFSETLKADTRLRLTGLSGAATLCGFVRQTWGARRFRRVETVRLGGGWRLSPELYDSLEEALRGEIAVDWSNALTLSRLGRLYIRNALRNLPLIPRYSSLARLSFGSVPVLALGAGPSLDELLETLARHFGQALQNRERPFYIVCVDTALEALRARNIRPDLAVILESQHWNLRDFIGLKDWEIPAAVDLSALPASARLPGIHPCLFFTPWTELRIFDRLGWAGLLPITFPPLGSVGLSAAAIALRISSGPVLTGGLDFSFSYDAYHARSTPGHRDTLRRQNRLRSPLNAAAFNGAFTAMSKTGRPVLSNPAMRNYRNLFEQEFSAESRLYDTAGSGLPLGIKTLSVREYLRLLETGGGTKRTANGENAVSARAAAEETLSAFIRDEKNRLITLRGILTDGTGSSETLETLIDECDYLWAHFPDCAGTGGRRPGTADIADGTPAAVSFLKRLRTEIEMFSNIFVMIEREAESGRETEFLHLLQQKIQNSQNPPEEG